MLNKKKIFKKIKNQKHFGENICLKKITLKNCDRKYLLWLKDKRINKYLETRCHPQTLESIRNFVTSCNKDNSVILFGIFKEKKHIGNIKIDINWFHGFCILGYMVGDKNYQGRNIGTESIKICVNLCFKYFKLRSCYASVYSHNIASIKVLKKNGFKKVSEIKDMYKLEKNLFSNELIYRLNNSKFNSN